MFKPNKKFKKVYDKIFKTLSPEAANLYLLLNELADENGQVHATEDELHLLACVRFGSRDEMMKYQLVGMVK